MKALSDKLKKGLPSERHETVDQIFQGTSLVSPLSLSEWIETMRDVTRLVNSVCLNLVELIGEVDIIDFIRLELLRLQYPAVYEVLYRQKDKIFSPVKNSGLEPRYQLAEAREKQLPVREEYKNDKYLKGYLMQHKESLGVEEFDVDKILRLVQSVFESNKGYSFSHKELLSIVYVNKFDRYFAYRLGESELSEIDFSLARSMPEMDFKEKITDWISQGMREDLQRRFLHIKKFDEREDFEKVIASIFHLASSQYTNSRGSFYVGYEGSDLFDKLCDYDDGLAHRLYKNAGGVEGLKRFIRSQFDRANSPFEFEAEFAEFANSRLFDIKLFPLSKQELKDISLGYFRRYCETATSLDDQVYSLFILTRQTVHTEVGNSTIRSEKVFPPEAKEIFIDFIQKDLDGFLRRNIDVEPFKKESYAVYKGVLDIFDSWPAFIEFLASQDVADWRYLEEFCRFFQEFDSQNYGKYIPFDFRVIPIGRGG